MPKRKEPAKSLRIKVISMGNAEVGKVSLSRGEGRDFGAAGRRAHWLGGRPLNARGRPPPRPSPQARAAPRGRGCVRGAGLTLATSGPHRRPTSVLLGRCQGVLGGEPAWS